MAEFDLLYKDGDQEYLIEKSKIKTIDENEVEIYTKEVSDALVSELVQLRKMNKITQQELADAIGIQRANVSRLERKLYTPTLGILMKYADSLGKRIHLELRDKE